MTTTATDIDFLMSTANEPEVSTAPAPEESVKTELVEAVDRAASHQEAIDDIIGVLIPEEKDETEEKAEAKTEKPKPEVVDKKPAAQPIVHDAQLLRLAESWGIGPDQAARYADEESLLGAVALREIRFRNSEAAKERQKPAEKTVEKAVEAALPEIKLDDIDFTDPDAIKTVVKTIAEQNKQLRAWADEKIAARDELIDSLRSGQEQIETREARDKEAKIAQLFDEKVTGWGEEFKELIGTPTQTWAKPGTQEHVELRKLHNYVRQRAAGYEALMATPATLSDLAGFLEEGRYALWPDRIQQSVRADISKGLKKQRGAVGLRPGKARSVEPAEQGNEPAMAAIGEFMAERGLDPWTRRRAS